MSKKLVMLMVLILALLSLSIPALAQDGYGEAPMLAEIVAAGDLPSVEERLPDNPLVMQPLEAIGIYGGDLRMSMQSSSYSKGDLLRTVGYGHLLRWNSNWSGVEPYIAESVDVNEDGSEYTFHLRSGMKWSDGMPFTTDDIDFWYHDVIMNADLFPNGPRGFLQSEGETAQLEIIDEYTFKLVFVAPKGQFLQFLSMPDGFEVTNFPRHYAEQYHIDYNPDGVEEMREELGLETWVDVFNRFAGDQWKDGPWINPDRPSLFAWVPATEFGPDSTQISFVRNPYFWAVDPEGNQLPYLDTVTFPVFEDSEVRTLQAMNGDIDFMWAGLSNENKPIVFDNQETGDYTVFPTSNDLSNTCVFYLNLTIEDPVKNALFNNKDFRIALSQAIDRQEMIDILYVGQGQPHQVAPRPESPYYDEEFAKQYTEYDVDAANALLDSIGLTERDGDGYRLFPNGERLLLIGDVRTENTSHIDCMELVQGYWDDIGVELQLNTIEQSLYIDRQRANQHDLGVNWGSSGLGGMLNAKPFVPVDIGAEYGIPWFYWYQNPDDDAAIEPPDTVKEGIDLYRELIVTADANEQAEIFRALLDHAEEQFYIFGISTVEGTYGIQKNSLGNVPDFMIQSWRFQTPGPYSLPLWYWNE